MFHLVPEVMARRRGWSLQGVRAGVINLSLPHLSLSLPVSVRLSVSVCMPMCGPEVDIKCLLLLFALFLR